jgi:crossover junction endodeoxyribonuclease RuvC
VRIIGIDPGSRATGYGVVDLQGAKLSRVASGVIRPDPARPLGERLAAIYEGLAGVIAATRPERAAVESVFAAKNARAALMLGQARGVALLACGIARLDAAEYSPMQVKLAVTGHGAASKEQVQRMVERLLVLASLGAADEADALAVAVCHAHSAPRGGRRAAGAALGSRG